MAGPVKADYAVDRPSKRALEQSQYAEERPDPTQKSKHPNTQSTDEGHFAVSFPMAASRAVVPPNHIPAIQYIVYLAPQVPTTQFQRQQSLMLFPFLVHVIFPPEIPFRDLTLANFAGADLSRVQTGAFRRRVSQGHSVDIRPIFSSTGGTERVIGNQSAMRV
jgi:hypothetical protein